MTQKSLLSVVVWTLLGIVLFTGSYFMYTTILVPDSVSEIDKRHLHLISGIAAAAPVFYLGKKELVFMILSFSLVYCVKFHPDVILYSTKQIYCALCSYKYNTSVILHPVIGNLMKNMTQGIYKIYECVDDVC